MKKIFLVLPLMFVCLLSYAEVKWFDLEQIRDLGRVLEHTLDEDNIEVTAACYCPSEEDVLKITRWQNMNDNFKYYITQSDNFPDTTYVAVFAKTNFVRITMVLHTMKGEPVIEYFCRVEK